MDKNSKKVITSSDRHNWRTPITLFEKIHSHMNFELDPCAETDNLGLPYFDKETDGLKMPWGDKNVFVNPPYGAEQKKWIEKAIGEKKALSVFLIPARVDTKLWQDVIFKHADAICFLKGRVRFVHPETGKASNPSVFPSALILFNANIFDRAKFAKACKNLGICL